MRTLTHNIFNLYSSSQTFSRWTKTVSGSSAPTYDPDDQNANIDKITLRLGSGIELYRRAKYYNFSGDEYMDEQTSRIGTDGTLNGLYFPIPDSSYYGTISINDKVIQDGGFAINRSGATINLNPTKYLCGKTFWILPEFSDVSFDVYCPYKTFCCRGGHSYEYDPNTPIR